jgi:alpha-1,6-mannosyltransferase
VIVAAERPSILSPTTHTNFFPHWMAGPLGGLWPGLTRSATTLKYLFTGAIALMYASYLIVLACVPRLRARWAIAAVIAVQAIVLLAPPLALTDIFNYVNYARMEVVHHLNPYTTIPILEPHNDPSFALSNWHELLSPYGPLFTLFTFAVVPLGVAASFWAIKTIIAAASLASLALVWKCARLLGRDPVAAIVLVGLNPIVLMWGLGGDHNDFLMIFFIMLGFYLLLGGDEHERPGWRDAGAGAALITAAAIKASAGVLLPVVLAGLLRAPRRLTIFAAGMAAAVALLGAASLIAFGLHIPDLSTQSTLVTNESVPNLLGLALGSGGESETLHSVMGAVLALSVLLCCVQAWRRPALRSAGSAPSLGGGSGGEAADRLVTASGWANVALLITLSWVLPWYVLWVLPFAALSSSRRLRITALALGVYLIVAWAPASGLLWNAIGFHPEKTSLGRLHQRYVKELLD